MKVCMLAYTYYENDNRVRRYAEALAKRGDEVEAVVIGKQGQDRYEVIDGVHVHRIQKRVIDEKGPLSYLKKLTLFFIRSAWFITRRHFAKPYQLIHVHSVPDYEVFAAFIPKLFGAKVILDIHDVVPEFYASKFKIGDDSMLFKTLVWIEKMSIWFSNHIIISNHLWKDKLIQRSVRPDKCTVFINYPDPAIFSPQEKSVDHNGTFVMCYPGTIIWHQGVDLAIEAMHKLKDEVPQLRFHIYGDGAHRDLIKDMIREYQLEDRVVLKGLVPMNQIATVMANVDLGIVPKRSDSFGDEAFSTKIPEFMSMGVPVVASKTSIDQYYFDDDMIQFFESENADDLAGKILELVNDESKRKRICDNSQRFVIENNWDKKKENYFRLVDYLVKKKK